MEQRQKQSGLSISQLKSIKRKYSVLSEFGIWDSYGSESLAMTMKQQLELKGYVVRVKPIEDTHHNIRWMVYYRVK